MNDVLSEMVEEGLTGLRQLLSGKHLRPAELALTILIVGLHPGEAERILMDSGSQARWEVAHDGES